MVEIITAVVSGVFGMLVVWLEVRGGRDRKKAEQRAAVRARESRLAMRMQDATLRLSLITVAALKAGHTNGDLDKAKEEAEAARKAYRDFVEEVAAEKVTKI